MPFDGLTITRLCFELNQILLNARIDKIHQPLKDELVFSIRQPGSGSFRLLLSANPRWARMHLTGEKQANPVNPPAFCMLLRKYLEGGKIQKITQLDFDRIIHIEIEALDEYREWRKKILICEFMGKHSNIILIHPENQVIIDAIKKYGSELSSFREVLPGKTYVRPSAQDKLNPLETSFDLFAKHFYRQGENTSLPQALFRTFSGLSPFSCRQICLGAGLDENMAVEYCGAIELLHLYQYLQSILRSFNEDIIQAQLVYQNQHPQDFAPYRIYSLPGSSIFFSGISEACQRYYDDSLSIARLESMKVNYARQLKEILDRLHRKRFHQEGDLTQARDNKRYQVWGELLTAYAHEIKKGQTEVSLEDFYSKEPVEIKLDPMYTPIQNAQRYFKIYNKSTKAIKHLQLLMAKNNEEINYLESVLLSIEQAETLELLEEVVEELEKEHYLKEKGKKRRKEQMRSQPRSYLSSDGLTILVGRNNRQNDHLSLKQAERGDLWLHTKEVPGTHVILKLPPHVHSIHDVPDRSLEEAACLAALYSKASQSDKVAVDYTFRSNVKKPAGARPGMVIYDNYWTIMVNPRAIDPEKLHGA